MFKYKSEEESEEENPVVASVGNQNLRKSEIAFITSEISAKEDSVNITNRYIQSWIRKQLMIKEAAKTITFDEAELNRKLLDYRYALMVYEFEKAHVKDNSDTLINDIEIERYYNENKENFSLKEIIVRTNFFKLEKTNPQNKALEKLLSARKSENPEKLRQIALDHSTNHYTEDSTWIRFEDIIINTPLASNNNKVELLRNNKLIKVDDEVYTYYFKILEYKLQDQIPPLDFVKDEISKILMNKKRVALVEQLQKDIYKRAQENNEFKIYD
ncbi:peptidyl-prolyl cis-trans isomerase [Belliella sp. DSM 107340]|uniref:Peptidyl-prolyl cis-trans isomerase n=1 Tax=Belliella calami TaxID=2923436 RepID=A0ABS9UPE1_9BACT|nr:peptidyl-prolyl cis-trans isomerase [Belliella calami]MCH7398495.1 peptidyl-prolyl cis-trans isomerase [Belliella calami]